MINPEVPDYNNTPANPQRPNYSYSLEDAAAPPVVTIATPFYNAKPHIFSETAQSVLNQSLQQWEWLIVNDGSTDEEALDNLARYRTLDKRIQVIDHPHNKGLSAARNTGFREAKTEFVVLLDNDDMLEPTAVEKWLWFLKTHSQYSFVNGYSVVFGDRQQLWARGFDQGDINLNESQIDHTALVRREVWQEVGGFDEENRSGLDDWEFWVKCADHGYWGAQIPEYLFWYRGRPNHGDRWSGLTQKGMDDFRKSMQKKYPGVYAGKFPKIKNEEPCSFASIPVVQPCQNLLAKPKQRILMIVPFLAMGGADKFNLDLVEQLTAKNYEVTICTTMPGANLWLAEFARITPDIFNLPNFLKTVDFPRFLLYLINSRQIDIVFISNSYPGYQFLPFLRAHCPKVTFVDCLHSELDYWKNGGYPRAGVGYQELLDLNIVSTHYLKDWMVKRGGDPNRIELCYTNIDPEQWNPAKFDRSSLRQELGVPSGKTLLLYGGRIAPEKRPLIFAEVIRRLAHEEKMDFICLITGNGPDLPLLKRVIRRYRLKKYIRFLGTVPMADVVKLQAAVDIFFLPSETEGISVALYESMAMETVPVAANVGGQKELVTPDCGYLIPHSQNEVEEYVATLKYLIESPGQRQTLARAGRARIIEHFNLNSMANRMVEVFNHAQTLSKTAPRPTVGKGLGIECATLAVEFIRVEEHFGYLWNSRQWRPSIDVSAILQGNTRAIKDFLIKFANRRGLRWLYQYKHIAKKILG